MSELSRVIEYRNLTEELLGLGEIPWKYGIGPEGWSASGKGALPIYGLEVDLTKFRASKLQKKAQETIHNIESALGGNVKVTFKNTIGAAFFIDERGYPPVDIVAELGREQFVFIKGQWDAGKTTLLNHIINAKQAEQTIVFYPKESVNTIHPAATIIGQGGDYAAIESGAEMWLQKAHSKQPVTHIVFEDWYLVLQMAPHLALLPFFMAIAGRENNIHITMVVHNDTAGGLLLKSNADLRRGFQTVDLFKGKNEKRFGYLIDFEGAKRYFDHPGPWQQHRLRREPVIIEEAPEFILNYADHLLALLAIKFNNGRCGVDKLNVIVAERLPKLNKSGGILTRWQIQSITKQWGDNGWLLDGDGVNVQRILSEPFARFVVKKHLPK